MSNVTVERDQPSTAPQPREPAGKPRKTAKAVKPGKGAKAPQKVAKKSAAKLTRKAGDMRAQPSNKTAAVLAMMRRAQGATLTQIMSATGWQRHTVRGFISIQGKKGKVTIESYKNAAGERTYKTRK